MNRIKEPSTWAGFAALLEAAKMVLPTYAPGIMALQGIFGGIAVLLRERGAGAGGGAESAA